MLLDEQRERIYRRLRLWETEDLLEALRTRDEEEWTPEALEVIERIVKERLGEVPNFENEEKEEEAVEAEPVFYAKEEAIRLLSLWTQARKWLVLAIVAMNLWVVWSWHRPYRGDARALIWWGVDCAIMVIGAAVEVFIVWWVMSTLAAMLKALLQIEEQTRPKAKADL